MRIFVCIALLAVVCGVFCTSATASDISGSNICLEHYASGGVYNGRESNGTSVDNGGVGGSFIDAVGFKYPDIIAGPNCLEFDYSICTACLATWGGTNLSNAPELYSRVDLLFTNRPKIDSVSIDPATNLAFFDMSHIYFNGNEIQVDWYQLAHDQNTLVKLDLGSGRRVQEPGTLAMLGSGMLGLAVIIRRKTACCE